MKLTSIEFEFKQAEVGFIELHFGTDGEPYLDERVIMNLAKLPYYERAFKKAKEIYKSFEESETHG